MYMIPIVVTSGGRTLLSKTAPILSWLNHYRDKKSKGLCVRTKDENFVGYKYGIIKETHYYCIVNNYQKARTTSKVRCKQH